MRILICDDNVDGCNEALKAARDGAPVGAECIGLYENGLKAALVALFKAVDATLKDGVTSETAFDGYDLIVLDNNLSHLSMEGARLTAEAIAGYIRAITDTPYVVSINKNPEIDVDLRFLIGDYATRADLAINTRHLANRALWTGLPSDADDGFDPWYWPTLATAAQRRRKQIAHVSANLDEPILPTLGFPDAAVVALSRHAKGALSPDASVEGTVGRQIREVTFRDFFRSSPRTLPAEQDRERLLEIKGDLIVSRVIAGELEHWFRRDVLGPQDVLVDAPHLLLRMPFLLGARAHDLEAWNASVTAREAPLGFEKRIFDQHLVSQLFLADMWLSSPAFWWPPLKENEKLNELFFQPNAQWGEFVFCEDTSTFCPRSELDAQRQPIEFAAEYEGSWNRRHVARLANYKYAPLSRLAM